MGKALLVVGLVLAGAGVLVMAGLPLGRLPGDIVYRRAGTTIYVPIATCVLVSVILSLVAALTRR